MITIDPIKRPPKKSSSVDTTEIMKEVDLKIADALNNSDVLELLESKADLSEIYSKKLIDEMLYISKFEWVDLGLPSGLKWASTNVGAEKPENFGLYFAWGETQGYSGITDTKKFSQSDYELWDNSSNTLTKYNKNSSYGTVDNLTVLEQVDDAAYQVDNSCRMPTKADFEELTANTTSTWETLNGVNGRRFTSKTNGNSIFVPAAGNCDDGSVFDVGSHGYLWSSSLNESSSSYGWFLYFYSGSMFVYSGFRYYGFTVRAVQEANRSSKLDHKETVSKLSELESKTVEIENQLVNVYTKSEIDKMIISTLNTEV